MSALIAALESEIEESFQAQRDEVAELEIGTKLVVHLALAC